MGWDKIEGIVLDPQTKNEILRKRVDSPKENYKEIINTVGDLINDISKNYASFTVGIGCRVLYTQKQTVQVSNTKPLRDKM